VCGRAAAPKTRSPVYGACRLTLKALRKKDYSEEPQTLGEHLKKRRKELGLLQREAAERLGCDVFTYINWEKGRTEPIASRFRPVLDFLGYDPTPEPRTFVERLEAKRWSTGMTFAQVADRLGWDEGTLTRYLNGTWRMPSERAQALENFLAHTTSRRRPRRWQLSAIGSSEDGDEARSMEDDISTSPLVDLLFPYGTLSTRSLR
jgi:transcriptional regulator with XRE-family HTH domain